MGRAMRLINRRPNRMAIDALAVSAGDTVLELGCGPGAAIADIVRRTPGCIVHGVDRSGVMIAQAAALNRSAIARGAVHLHQASFARLPLPVASVDRILAVNVAYFWTDIGAVLAEMHRVLKPHGRIVIYVTDASVMRGWKFAGPDTHRLFDADTLTAALAAAPFRPDMVTTIQVQAGPGVPGLIATISTDPVPVTQPRTKHRI